MGATVKIVVGNTAYNLDLVSMVAPSFTEPNSFVFEYPDGRRITVDFSHRLDAMAFWRKYIESATFLGRPSLPEWMNVR